MIWNTPIDHLMEDTQYGTHVNDITTWTDSVENYFLHYRKAKS